VVTVDLKGMAFMLFSVLVFVVEGLFCF